MPRIRFTGTPKLPRDMAHLGYVLGTEVDLTDDQANRWLRRGVAEIIPDRQPEPAPRRYTPRPDEPTAGAGPTGSTGDTGATGSAAAPIRQPASTTLTPPSGPVSTARPSGA